MRRATGLVTVPALVAFMLAAPCLSLSALAAKRFHSPVSSKLTFETASGFGQSGRHSGKILLTGGNGRSHLKHQAKNGKFRYASYGGGGSLQCVPFARAASGIELKGNAANWWDAAAGVYQRGQAPEAGSVLNFRSTGRMRLGHVAVVTAVLGSREIEIEHANWAGPGANRGGVSRGIPVQDVSEANDWSAVRVGLGRSGDFGSVYPTYGFIYDRPDSGVMVARAQTPTLDVGSGPRVVAVMDREVAQLPRHRGHKSHLRTLREYDLTSLR